MYYDIKTERFEVMNIANTMRMGNIMEMTLFFILKTLLEHFHVVKHAKLPYKKCRLKLPLIFNGKVRKFPIFLSRLLFRRKNPISVSLTQTVTSFFEAERKPLTVEEYGALKALALKSAQDFLALYEAIPDRNKSCLPERKTFYGSIPPHSV